MPSVAELLVCRVRDDHARQGRMALDAGGDVHSTPVHVAILTEDDVPTIKELAREIAKPIPMERDGKRIVMTLIEREGQCRALSYALHVAVMFMDDGTKKLLRSLFSELAAALEEPVTPPGPHVEAARKEFLHQVEELAVE